MNLLDSAQGQGQLWLLFAAAGCLCAPVFHLTVLFFGSGKMSAAGRFFAGIFCALITCAACILFANGAVRGYMFTAALFGAAAFHFAVGRPFCRGMQAAFRLISLVFSHLGRSSFMRRLMR